MRVLHPKTLSLAAAAALAAAALRAENEVPRYDVTDSYVTAPTMLLRMGVDGEIREVWSGMDAGRKLHVPLFLEMSVFAQIREGTRWTDLRTLAYSREGTRPGLIHLASADGRVRIAVTSRKNAEQSPIFVTYAFSAPADVRLHLRFKHPQFTQGLRADDAAGLWEYTTAWRNVNSELKTTGGPKLILATYPAGRTASGDAGERVKEIDGAREVTLCVDATEHPLAPAAGEPYAAAWTRELGGTADTEEDYVPDRVHLATDDPALDRLFRDSVDAVVSSQFASGDVIADEFFYRDSWLRDGSYSMIGLSLAGDHRAAERYFSFWDSQRDFSVGGEREAQQPAIGITAMWLYSRLCPDSTGFLGKVWPYAKYYSDYYARRIAKEGMLNVSEEWICFIPSASTWPNAEIYSGLRASVKMANALGHAGDAARWTAAADALQARFLAQAYDPDRQRIIPMAGPPGQGFTDPEFPKAESRNGPLRDDRVDAGMLAIGRLEALGRGQGIIAVDDPRFTSTQAQIEKTLENPDHAIFRFGPNPTSPHAPGGELDTWPIIMSWAAQDEWLLGHTGLAWRYLLSGIEHKRFFDADRACDYLPENWDRRGFPDKPLITWSHGDFVTSVLMIMLGLDLEPERADLAFSPSLPTGMNHASLKNFTFRDWALDISLDRVTPTALNRVPPDTLAVQVAFRPLVPSPKAFRFRLGQGAPAVIEASPGMYQRSIDAFCTASSYFIDFGRNHHAAERAAILSRVLDGVNPELGPQDRCRDDLEAVIVRTETEFKPTAQ